MRHSKNPKRHTQGLDDLLRKALKQFYLFPNTLEMVVLPRDGYCEECEEETETVEKGEHSVCLECGYVTG